MISYWYLLPAFVAGGLVAALYFVRRRRRWQQKQRTQRIRKLPIGDDLFPIDVADFRAIVRMLTQQKAALLSQQYGKPLRFTAQDGEDLLLAEFFNYKPDGFYIEIGAFDGVTFSNSFFFEQIGWKGVLVEPLPGKYAACVANRPNSTVVHAALGKDADGKITIKEPIGALNGVPLGTYAYVRSSARHKNQVANIAERLQSHQVPFRTFESVMQQSGIEPQMEIDFISIDCEGMDFEILQSIDLTRWQPRLILVEHVRQPLLEYMRNNGYTPLLRVRANTIFGRNSADCVGISVEAYWRALGVHTTRRTPVAAQPVAVHGHQNGKARPSPIG